MKLAGICLIVVALLMGVESFYLFCWVSPTINSSMSEADRLALQEMIQEMGTPQDFFRNITICIFIQIILILLAGLSLIYSKNVNKSEKITE
jgi:hypothetical protein